MWISVLDKLPEINQTVFVFVNPKGKNYKLPFQENAYYDGENFRKNHYLFLDEVTHWMPMFSVPSEKKPNVNKPHLCKTKDNDCVIQYWKTGDGYKELEEKWVMEAYDAIGTSTLSIINYCPFCGISLWGEK